MQWFRTYKTFEGKGENEFAFQGKWLDRDTTLKVIESTHQQWRALLKRRPIQSEPWLHSEPSWKPLDNSAVQRSLLPGILGRAALSQPLTAPSDLLVKGC